MMLNHDKLLSIVEDVSAFQALVHFFFPLQKSVHESVFVGIPNAKGLAVNGDKETVNTRCSHRHGCSGAEAKFLHRLF
jgi:hypothetical protein